jgi:DNA-binding SARP family transcriptional activator
LVACHRRDKFRDLIERIFIDADREADIALFMLRNHGPADLRHAADCLLKAMPHKVPAPLAICCLGGFSVCVGEQLIPEQMWRSAKATLLFKYLVLHFDRGWIPKDRLLEIAWPGEDPAVTTPRLHVALNALRKLFEPDLKRGMPSAYILRNNEGYRLEIGEAGSIDFLEFVKTADEAIAIDAPESDTALALGLKALSLYRGSLLEENPYDEWLMEDRESLRMKYLRCLSEVIRLYEKQAAWHRCIELGETYLMHDEFAEPIYRKLMMLYAKVGNLPRVTQTFEKCKESINDGLDCPLSDTTMKLYDKIVNSNRIFS